MRILLFSGKGGVGVAGWGALTSNAESRSPRAEIVLLARGAVN